jgi:hypothetical protein
MVGTAAGIVAGITGIGGIIATGIITTGAEEHLSGLLSRPDKTSQFEQARKKRACLLFVPLKSLLLAHDLFGKPLHTFPDHALGSKPVIFT